ncbi:MAG TPA: hypothetical protein VHP83_16300 [Aggregatilineaceae bacterium]|nr:hypothetical protein [Aggregatilineaceae bacterium]
MNLHEKAEQDGMDLFAHTLPLTAENAFPNFDKVWPEVVRAVMQNPSASEHTTPTGEACDAH